MATTITGILKTLDRKRIDKKKAYGVEVDNEAQAIGDRLRAANEPFTMLMDAYKAERAKILADKKAVEDLKEMLQVKELDHEMALLINKTYEFDKEQELKAQVEHDEQIRKQATIDAEARQKQSITDSLQREKNAENARLVNKEHCAFINNEVLCSLVGLSGITDDQAKSIVIAMAKNKIPHTTINY